MPVFLCRWPNGDCSIVSAPTKEDAISLLDEEGAAEPGWLHPIRHFMAHFQLVDEGGLVLNTFGGDTNADIEKAYPVLTEARMLAYEAEDKGGPAADTSALVAAAVRRERERFGEPPEDVEEPLPH